MDKYIYTRFLIREDVVFTEVEKIVSRRINPAFYEKIRLCTNLFQTA